MGVELMVVENAHLNREQKKERYVSLRLTTLQDERFSVLNTNNGDEKWIMCNKFKLLLVSAVI